MENVASAATSKDILTSTVVKLVATLDIALIHRTRARSGYCYLLCALESKEHNCENAS